MMALVFHFVKAQSFSLSITSKDNPSLINSVAYKKIVSGKMSAFKEIELTLNKIRQQGYLLAQTDSIAVDSLLIKASIETGKIFKTGQIKLGNLNKDLASKLRLAEKSLSYKNFSFQQFTSAIEKILLHYENNGYPFATVKLDSIEIKDEQIKAVFDVQKNKFFKIDSIKIIGTNQTSSRFINRYLGIKEGMAYNEFLLNSISQKLRQLPFITEKQVQRVQLTERKNKLLLFLDKKEASQFDGIIGLLPDATTKKTVITGDIKLKLVNGVLKSGETFDLQWRRLKSQTQDFNGRIIYPYLLGTPIGIDYNLKIYRLDTTFIDVNNNIGLHYYFSGLNHFKIYYKQRNSNLISTSGYEFITTLPDYADISTKAYGIGAFIEKLDYRFNPKKGVAFQFNFQAGNRSVDENPEVNKVAYQNILLKSSQYQGDIQLSGYIPLSGNHVLKLAVQSAGIFGNSTIFKNELFRIGGLKTLRGFDEESIFASVFVIPTVEYRFVFAQNSSILLFAEGAWYENNSNKKYISDMPLSTGAGINFETKAGILSINYALGSQFKNGFDVRNGKIHIGLTALF